MQDIIKFEFDIIVRISLTANFSLNQTLLTFLLCETNLDGSDPSTRIRSLAVCVKEVLPFARHLSLALSFTKPKEFMEKNNLMVFIRIFL